MDRNTRDVECKNEEGTGGCLIFEGEERVTVQVLLPPMRVAEWTQGTGTSGWIGFDA